jgi:hypothetical protein
MHLTNITRTFAFQEKSRDYRWSDAGISAALRARELDPDIAPSVIVADEFPNFSICGLPYYISHEVKDWRNLAHRTKQDIESQGIRLALRRTATAVGTNMMQVTGTAVIPPITTLTAPNTSFCPIATGARMRAKHAWLRHLSWRRLT